MKAGYNIGIDWAKRRVLLGTEYQMMEDFMYERGIRYSSNTYSFQSLENAKKARQAVVSYLLCDGPGKNLLEIMFNMQEGVQPPFPGGSDPRVSAAARNTSLFAPRGPAMGDF